MTERLFLNAPIQNGDFAFDTSPHKLVGMRLAGTLNDLVDNPVAPHLWNTVRLSGDNEYGAYLMAGGSLDRMTFEWQKIDDRYNDSAHMQRPDTERPFVTDVDPDVVALAHTMVERGLTTGVLKIQNEMVQMCAGCGNHVGAASTCGACNSTDITTGHADKLMAVRDEDVPLIQPSDTYASVRTKYIADTAGHVPNPLSVSVTRRLGIPLEVFGLEGQVLDPRAGLQVTALAAAEQLGANEAVMLTTASVALKFLAYGQHFRVGEHASLRYGLYGRIPYKEIVNDPPVRESLELERMFQDWFLPLQAFITREPISTEQTRALRKFFGKLCMGNPSQEAVIAVKNQVEAERLRWVTDKVLLAGVRPAS